MEQMNTVMGICQDLKDLAELMPGPESSPEVEAMEEPERKIAREWFQYRQHFLAGTPEELSKIVRLISLRLEGFPDLEVVKIITKDDPETGKPPTAVQAFLAMYFSQEGRELMAMGKLVKLAQKRRE